MHYCWPTDSWPDSSNSMKFKNDKIKNVASISKVGYEERLANVILHFDILNNSSLALPKVNRFKYHGILHRVCLVSVFIQILWEWVELNKFFKIWYYYLNIKIHTWILYIVRNNYKRAVIKSHPVGSSWGALWEVAEGKLLACCESMFSYCLYKSL